MTPSVERTLENHKVRIGKLEADQKDHGKKLDRLQWFIITTLVAVLYHIAFQSR